MDQQLSMAGAAQTAVERKSDRELEVRRLFDASPDIVFKAWSQPELFRRWWAPKSFGITIEACDMDVRTGGKYRLVLSAGGGEPMAFYGKYLDVVPGQRIVWTNDEGEEEGAVTTVTFEDQGGKTLVTFHELYPTKEGADEALQGSAMGLPAQFAQLDELLGELDA